MSLRNLAGVAVAGILLVPSVSGCPVFGQTPPAASVVESLGFDPAEDGGVLRVQMSGAVPLFACTLPGSGNQDLIVEMPGTGTRLPSRLDLKNPVVPEAFIEQASGTGSVLRMRLKLGQGVLTRIEQMDHALLLRFSRATVPELSEYRIGVGDKLEISVFGHEDLSKVVEVRADGSINYPLIGDLHVAGKTAAEIDGEVTRVLGKDYLVDPQVSVDVREYQSQWVTIIGEVRTPGKYVLRRNMRLIDVLAEAGGATKDAGSRILITRLQEDGAPGQLLVDRDRLLRQDNPAANLPLRHGDIVNVAEKDVFYIRGEVTKPGAYLLESGMTVMKAISLAGGFTQFASRKQVDVLRSGDNGAQEKITVNLKAIEAGKQNDFRVGPNDTIIVPRRIF